MARPTGAPDTPGDGANATPKPPPPPTAPPTLRPPIPGAPAPTPPSAKARRRKRRNKAGTHSHSTEGNASGSNAKACAGAKEEGGAGEGGADKEENVNGLEDKEGDEFSMSGAEVEVRDTLREISDARAERDGVGGGHIPPAVSVLTLELEFSRRRGRPLPFRRLGMASAEALMSALARRGTLEMAYDNRGCVGVRLSRRAAEAAAAEREAAREERAAPMHPDMVAGIRNELGLTAPPGVAAPGQLQEQRLHRETVAAKGYVEVQATQIYSPDDFYVCLRENLSRVNDIMDDLQAFYAHPSAASLTVGYVRQGMIGLPVAALYVEGFTNQGWHRALVTSVESLSEVSLFFVDYGSRGVVHLSNCRFLLEKYASRLPMQAIRARLSGLIPYRGERRWPQRATGYLEEYAIYVNAFLDGTGGFVAQVQGETEEVEERLLSCSGNTARLSWHRLELVLYDTLTPEQEYNLNQQMLKDKTASADPSCLVDGYLPWEDPPLEPQRLRRPIAEAAANGTGAAAGDLAYAAMAEDYFHHDRQRRRREQEEAMALDSPLSLPAEEEEAGDEDEDATDILEAERRFIAKAHFKCSEWVRSTEFELGEAPAVEGDGEDLSSGWAVCSAPAYCNQDCSHGSLEECLARDCFSN